MTPALDSYPVQRCRQLPLTAYFPEPDSERGLQSSYQIVRQAVEVPNPPVQRILVYRNLLDLANCTLEQDHILIAVDSRGASRPTDMRREMQTSCLHGQTGSGVKLKLYEAKTMHIYRYNWQKLFFLGGALILVSPPLQILGGRVPPQDRRQLILLCQLEG